MCNHEAELTNEVMDRARQRGKNDRIQSHKLRQAEISPNRQNGETMIRPFYFRPERIWSLLNVERV
jgi:hypothetical protein